MKPSGLQIARCGFTLLELILTIAIIVILALLVVPKIMNAYPRVAVESEGIRLRADITYAQQLAISNTRSHRVVFDSLGERVRIYRVEGEELVSVSERDLASRVDLASTTFTGGYVEFNLLGEPSAGGTVTLHGANGPTVTVTVKPGTGLVTVVCDGKEL